MTATTPCRENGQPHSQRAVADRRSMARHEVARVDVLLRFLETVPEIDGRLIPIDGVLREAAMHQSGELARDRGLELAQRARRVLENRRQDGGGVVPPKGRCPVNIS